MVCWALSTTLVLLSSCENEINPDGNEINDYETVEMTIKTTEIGVDKIVVFQYDGHEWEKAVSSKGVSTQKGTEFSVSFGSPANPCV